MDFPLLVAEWDHERNRRLDPAILTAGSNLVVWWCCSAGHRFRRSPNGRTNNGRRSGAVTPCPRCSRGGLRFWTWTRIVATAKSVAAEEGALPPAAKFQRRGLAMLVQCLYQRGKSWDDLRRAVGSYQTSRFVPSRSGIRWRSHPEASLSNFLFARRVEHQRGRKYPVTYSAASGKTYGYFDLLFHDPRGRPIDVEIWGDKPHGHAEERYRRVRQLKEQFNRGRTDFLGIHWADCFDDRRLQQILQPYLGTLKPDRFRKAHDRLVESSHWSNVDELLASCRQLAAEQPNKKFPTEGWLRKRGKWATRSGPAHNTIAVYIKTWAGGIRQLRRLLGQPEHSTVQWDRSSALRELKRWYRQYGKSPGALRRDCKRGKRRMPAEELNRGACIEAAIRKYVGSLVSACALIGVQPSRRSPKSGLGSP